jgi:hypothetical protein
MLTMRRSEIRVLRTQLRELNIEFSALVRAPGGEGNAAKKDELRARRRLLMAHIAEAAEHSPARGYPSPAPLDAVGQAA